MKLTSQILSAGLLAMLLGAAACGGPAKEAEKPTVTPTAPKAPEVSPAAEDRFNAALDAFNAHDKASDWNEASCGEMAKMFETAAQEQKGGKLSEAVYNAGLAYQRCGNDAQAKQHFQDALAQDPKSHFARAQLALYQYKADSNEDAAIGALQQAVLDAQFQNVPALVDLAMFQMTRDSAAGGDRCKDDMDCAKQNLQRALAIDDSYMPAFNQLALYYFQLAKKRAGSIKQGKRGRQIMTNAALAKRADVQQLDLAAVVCSQAVRKNASYAPIHNTAGLIQNELGQVNSAVQEFATATKLDPKFFEAQMNYAAVNLSFRGFEQAQQAYQKALEMRPNDYDAHLGLALALRGQISDVNYDKQVAAVQAELDACKKIDAARPDAYYNEGILTQEYKAKSGGGDAQTIAALNSAKAIFQSFIDRSSDKPEYAGAIKRSKERMQDMEDTITFINTKVAPEPGAAPAPPAPPGGPAAPAPPAAGGAPAPPAPPAAGGAPAPPPPPAPAK
jgi:tetratricopeptide (TPR) repeat protein